MPDYLSTLFYNVVSYPGVKFLAAHVLINVVVALAVGIREGNFDFRKVGNFIYAKLLPYVLGYYVVALLGDTANVAFIGPVAWAAIVTTLTADLLDNLGRLGLQLPPVVNKLISTD